MPRHPQIRGSLKSWTKLWCCLKPGVLLIYKTPKADHWVGTVLLSACKLIERPSKKDGFCFKLYHPLDKSIWAVKVSHTWPDVSMCKVDCDHVLCRLQSASLSLLFCLTCAKAAPKIWKKTLCRPLVVVPLHTRQWRYWTDNNKQQTTSKKFWAWGY